MAPIPDSIGKVDPLHLPPAFSNPQSSPDAYIYVFGPGDYRGDWGLENYDTLLMIGGTIENITIGGYAIANIEGTSPLGSLPGDGGIWALTVGAYGTLNLSGGEIKDMEAQNDSIINMTGGSVDYFEMHSRSRSHLYGGQIGTLASDQTPVPPNADGVTNRINIYCLAGYSYDDGSNMLSGQWWDGTDFSIHLLDIGNYPTYDLIEFHVPEPGTIVFLGLGSIWLRRRFSRQ